MDLPDAIIALIGAILVSVIFFRDLRYMLRKRASENWPTTQATIESTTTRRKVPGSVPQGLIFRAWFTYMYCVSGTQYTGSFVLITGNRKSAEWLKLALAGKRVVVRYNTGNPEVSFLEDTQLMGKTIHQDPRWTY